MSGTRILVVGGGPAGAAAAHRLTGEGFDVTIVEQSGRLGGRLRSELVHGCLVEAGAHFLTNFYPRTLELIEQLRLRDKLVDLENDVFIVRGGSPYSLRSGSTLFGSKLLSQRAKARLAAEVVHTLRHWRTLDIGDISRAEVLDDGSVADALAGRGGKELLSYVFQPALNSFLYWTPDRTSAALVPVLVKAAMSLRHMYVLRDGYVELVERAARRATVLLDAEAMSIREHDSGCRVRIRDAHGTATDLEADGVVCAVPATRAAELVRDPADGQRAFLDQVRYSAAVALLCRVPNTGLSRNRAVLYPASESADLAATTATAVQDGTPLDHIIMKIHASGTAARQLLQQSDDDVSRFLYRAAGLGAEPPEQGCRRVFRWPEALPEVDVGYFRRLRRFEQENRAYSRVTYAGDYLGGPFVEGAIGSGQRAADRLARTLAGKT